jgi:hypothetical protein
MVVIKDVFVLSAIPVAVPGGFSRALLPAADSL